MNLAFYKVLFTPTHALFHTAILLKYVGISNKWQRDIGLSTGTETNRNSKLLITSIRPEIDKRM